MTPTETGLYGCPSDYPADFVTIETARDLAAMSTAEGYIKNLRAIAIRDEIVTALIDLAHDLDARGLVLVPEVATVEMTDAGSDGVYVTQDSCFEQQAKVTYAAMIATGVAVFPPLPPEPSSPNTGS